MRLLKPFAMIAIMASLGLAATVPPDVFQRADLQMLTMAVSEPVSTDTSKGTKKVRLIWRVAPNLPTIPERSFSIPEEKK
jgi:hypothetical protein